MNRKKFTIGLTAALGSVCVLAAGCGIGYRLSDNSSGTATSSTVLTEEQQERYSEIEDKLSEIDALLDHYYLNDDEIDTQTMEDNIMKGYVDALGEKYTAYYTADEYQSLMESTSGAYEGVGMVVSQNVDTKVITVIQVFEDGPGDQAGLLAGDIICKVNGEDVTDEDINLVVKDIKGEAGTEVTVTVYRPDSESYIDMTMERAHIEQPTVSHEMMEDNIGYIYISSFDEVTESQFDEAIADLQDQGMEALVVDLRNNPGGVLDTVCNMLDRILPKDQLLVYTVDKDGNKEETYTQDDEELDIPIAVVVNGNSASASEIFTAALQDYGKAVIVGETTFGKGIVQIIVPLSDGSAVKMTTSKYYTPKGVCIHEIGVVPDIQIAADGSDPTEENTGETSGTTGETEAETQTETEKKTDENTTDTSAASEGENTDTTDYQLNAAVKALKEQLSGN